MQKYTSVVDAIFHKKYAFFNHKNHFFRLCSLSLRVSQCMRVRLLYVFHVRFLSSGWSFVFEQWARIVQCLWIPNRTLTHLNYIRFLHSPAQIKLVFCCCCCAYVSIPIDKLVFTKEIIQSQTNDLFRRRCKLTHSAPSTNDFFNTNNQHEIYLFTHFCQMCCGHLTIG